MRTAITNQVRTQGCAKALPGLSRAESQYGFNLVSRITAGQRKTNKPNGIERSGQERAQASTHVKQSPALMKKTQCWRINEACKVGCR